LLPFEFVVDHVTIKINYEILSYIGSLTTFCRFNACH